jgi:hypothetical protein
MASPAVLRRVEHQAAASGAAPGRLVAHDGGVQGGAAVAAAQVGVRRAVERGVEGDVTQQVRPERGRPLQPAAARRGVLDTDLVGGDQFRTTPLWANTMGIR